MQNDIHHINYNFDKDKLWAGWEKYKHTVETYTDPRFAEWRKDKEYFKKIMNSFGVEDYDDEGFKVADLNVKEFDYGMEICDLFEITDAKFKYYHMVPNFVLPFHSDYGMQCSINIMIGDNPAPIRFQESDTTHHYTQALINVSKKHGVTNGDLARILFRLSVNSESFESLRDKIISKTT